MIVGLLLVCFVANTQATSIDDVMKYIGNAVEGSTMTRAISVFGSYTYTTHMRTSVIKYLFEGLTITENIAPLGNYNRPGDVYAKHYVCVHDTGDETNGAATWSEIVYNQGGAGWTYEASFQYVIDNYDCYHNIPDNEVAYHAGDNIRVYDEIDTGVSGTNPNPEITLSDGYYFIDGVNTWIAAPNPGWTLSTEDINDHGIRVVLRSGRYYLGKTWYSSGYGLIANYGGNTNSIGIESCIIDGEDIFYTWQRLAKLVGKLLYENSLTPRDVQSHHFFSGKHCPMTMREAKMWDHFLNMVEVEHQMLKYVKEGYSFSFSSGNTGIVNNAGRVISAPSSATEVSFTVTVTGGGATKSQTFKSLVQPLTSI